MGLITLISWCDHTFNPVRGCVHEGLNSPQGPSPACANCYAEAMSKRNPAVLGEWGFEGERKFAAESYWRQPLAWQAAAQANGEIKLVFVASLADVFEGEPPTDPAGQEGRDGPRADYLPMLERLRDLSPLCPNLRFLMLTKRPWNALALYRKWGTWPKTWWMGFTAEDQPHFDRRAPFAVQIPAEVIFVSAEPLLGPIDMRRFLGDLFDYCPEEADFEAMPESQRALGDETGCQGCPGNGKGECAAVMRRGIGWVITGGESGANARPSRPDWFRSLRDQCDAVGVPFHFKQWGAYAPMEWSGCIDHDPRGGAFPGPVRAADDDGGPWRPGYAWSFDEVSVKLSKKDAGHRLDGVERMARPVVS